MIFASNCIYDCSMTMVWCFTVTMLYKKLCSKLTQEAQLKLGVADRTAP